jgi:hypothetical protein
LCTSRQLSRLERLVAQQVLAVLGEVLERLERRQHLGDERLGRRLALLLLDEPAMSSASSTIAWRQRSSRRARSAKLVRLQAGKAAAPRRSPRPPARRRAGSPAPIASPVAGFVAVRRPPRPSTSRPPTHEWRVARPATVSVAINRLSFVSCSHAFSTE